MRPGSDAAIRIKVNKFARARPPICGRGFLRFVLIAPTTSRAGARVPLRVGSLDHLGERVYIGQEFLTGFEILSFCMRKYRVERFIPKRAAAPFGPASTPFVCFKVLQMWPRSASSSVMGSSV